MPSRKAEARFLSNHAGKKLQKEKKRKE